MVSLIAATIVQSCQPHAPARRCRCSRLWTVAQICVAAPSCLVVNRPSQTTQKPKPAENFVTLLGDAQQSTKRQRQEEIPRETTSATTISFFFSCAVDTPMHVLDPQMPKPARQLSPAEGEDSIPKRQKPAEVNTVWMISWRRSNSTTDRRTEGASQHGQVRCGRNG